MKDEAFDVEKARAELEEFLSKPFPKKRPPPSNPEVKRDAEVFQMLPGKRPWVARPVAASSYVGYAPTQADRLEEIRREVAKAAREARLRADRFGLGLWSRETIDDVVRRQNGDDE
jgi:hypothetical protein